jgi:hypothetical protein
MPKHSYDIEISAASEQEAETKMKAITTLLSKLTAKELEKLSYIIEKDPKTTALAKQFLGL